MTRSDRSGAGPLAVVRCTPARSSEKAAAVKPLVQVPRVEVPESSPELTTPLARVLLRILLRAAEAERAAQCPAVDPIDAIAS